MKLICSRCNLEKDSNKFYSRPSTARGFQYICKRCENFRRQLSRYGLTEEEFFIIFEGQGKACAVCCKPLEIGSSNTHVDHNHETEKVRGILCGNCNTAFGLLKEDLDIILALVDYKLLNEEN